MLKDSPEQYGTLSKTLHWLMAFLIAWQLLKFGDRIAEGEHWVGETLVPWHVSIGALLLVLVIIRLLWAISQRDQRPMPESDLATAVKVSHRLLYTGLVLMPITGIMAMLGGGHGIKVFGLQLVAKGEEIGWAEILGSLHSPLIMALTVLIVGHIGMALFHHFIKADDTLRRML